MQPVGQRERMSKSEDPSDHDIAAELILAGERLSFTDLVALIDAEIERRSHAPSWLIEASLAARHADVLSALRKMANEVPHAHARAARRRAAQIAADVSVGSMSPVLGARELVALRFRADVPDDDPDFLCIVGIESETDALPLGPVRAQWDPRALARMDDEIRRAERWAVKVGTEAFASIARRWKREP
jgi:hypothetical protein